MSGKMIETVKNPDRPWTAEVRCSVRFPLSVPISIFAGDRLYEATTENISASGVLFRSKEDLGVDSKVEFILRMPASIVGAENDVDLHCFGRVVRSYKDHEEFHAAAIIDDYVFGHAS